MSLVLEGAIPPPHLLQSRAASWPNPYPPHHYPASASSPIPMSPRSMHSYVSRMPGNPVPPQEFHNLATSGWYGPSIPAPDRHHETNYATYAQYMPPQTTSIGLPPPTPVMQYSGKSSVSATQVEPLPAAVSPVSAYSRDSAVLASTRSSEEPQPDLNAAAKRPMKHLRGQSHLVDRSPSSSGTVRPVPAEASWAMDPLGIHSSHETYYSPFPTMTPSPRLSEPLLDQLPSAHLTSPQPRRMYTPIAPQPMEVPRSHGVKRAAAEDAVVDDVVSDEAAKRRKRSDSNTSSAMQQQFELSDEDKLLLQLKEEESMPWKDIAVRFQSDLGKSYQIPALQMRLKRLRERMRVWSEPDVRALRMAHEYWAQNKFDIIAQKMLDFGAQEKWTARQCARKWAEIEPAPTPYAAHYEQQQHLQHGFAPYAMSPIEPPHAFLSYMPVS